jgi:hypothetical protein
MVVFRWDNRSLSFDPFLWILQKRDDQVEQAGFLPVLPIGAIGSYAADVCEPR